MISSMLKPPPVPALTPALALGRSPGGEVIAIAVAVAAAVAAAADDESVHVALHSQSRAECG